MWSTKVRRQRELWSFWQWQVKTLPGFAKHWGLTLECVLTLIHGPTPSSSHVSGHAIRANVQFFGANLPFFRKWLTYEAFLPPPPMSIISWKMANLPRKTAHSSKNITQPWLKLGPSISVLTHFTLMGRKTFALSVTSSERTCKLYAAS